MQGVMVLRLDSKGQCRMFQHLYPENGSHSTTVSTCSYASIAPVHELRDAVHPYLVERLCAKPVESPPVAVAHE